MFAHLHQKWLWMLLLACLLASIYCAPVEDDPQTHANQHNGAQNQLQAPAAIPQEGANPDDDQDQ